MPDTEIVGGFFLDTEPYGFEGFKEIVDNLNEPSTELPLDVDVNTPWGTVETLCITYVDREHVEDGDLMVEGLLGEKKTPIRIYWQEEIEDAQVESGISLASELFDLAERYDFLPPEIRDYDGQVAYELTGVGFEPTDELGTTLLIGDPEQELCIHLVVYGSGKASSLLKERLPIQTAELAGYDANGDPILKFIPRLMDAGGFHELLGTLREINSEVELTLDITMIWESP
jgi:hypothetical protein